VEYSLLGVYKFLLIKLNRLWAQLTPAQLNIRMAENSEGKRDFTKFNGVNFPQWKFAVKLKLKQKKLDGIVLGNDKKPTEVIWTKISNWILFSV
jgi:hypothetical protein